MPRCSDFCRPFPVLAVLACCAIPAHAEAPAPADFQGRVVGFVARHCLTCHGEKVHKADLSLQTFRDEASLVKGRKVWQHVLDQVREGTMPPPRRPRPSAAEIEAFLTGVADVFARADRNAKPDPGRVTVRRLNRAEYNNTIRDLVGVDFNPAEDFPADDIGHGFDNIGDVLTLSPVLLERYLAAAENIMQQAIVVDPPKPPVRTMSGQYLEPAGRNVPQSRFRPLSGTGDLNTPYNLTQDGEYTFRVRAYAKAPDDRPIKATVRFDEREIGTVEVKALEKKAEVYTLPLTLPAGRPRVSLTLVEPKDDQTLFVEFFQLEGPKDTRPASQRRLLACSPDKPRAEQTREVLTRFASKAFRRPATPAEVERLAQLVDAAERGGEKWEAGMQLAFQAVLVSPKFLFRVELDDRPDRPDPYPLDEYQLASRLSYFLWNSMPDDELFDLAARQALTANLDAQVQRLLNDPRSRSLVDNFAMQWLQLRRLKTFAPDPQLFPTFNELLRAAMLKETELFFEAIVREDRSVLDLIDADFTFVNEPLARHYGIAYPGGNLAGSRSFRTRGQSSRGSQFQRVSLAGTGRGGLLTQASVLTVTSNPTRTSPVKRGRWVLEQLLGTPPPPPPPDVPELAEGEKAVLTGSLRQRLEQHRANPACASCHARMDPLGFAFENFNAIGAFRAKDGDFPIDPSGTLPDGQTFRGPDELKAILKGKKDLFARCLTEKLLTYGLGRGLEHYDRPAVERIVAALGREDYKFSALVREIVKSDPFRLRRGKDQSE